MKPKIWTWFYSKDGTRCLGYLYNPYKNRDKVNLVETLGLINDCTYNLKEIKLIHKA